MNNSLKIKKLYTKYIDLYHLIFMTLFRYHKGLEVFFKKKEYLQQNFKILDAGCGSGVVTKILYQISINKGLNSTSFYGFDLTDTMLKRCENWANEANIHNIYITQADVLKPALPDNWNNFDLIASSAMLEYVPKNHMQVALKNLFNLLQAHGKLLIFITKKNLMNKILINSLWKANMYEKNEITMQLIDTGFKNIHFASFQQPYTYLNMWGYVIEATK